MDHFQRVKIVGPSHKRDPYHSHIKGFLEEWYGNPSHMPAPQQAAQVQTFPAQQEQLVQVAKDQVVQKRVDSSACPFVG